MYLSLFISKKANKPIYMFSKLYKRPQTPTNIYQLK